jgi:hypothetical protein
MNRFDTGAALIKRHVMGAGEMGINHFFGCAVLIGVLHDISFCSNALISLSNAQKVACTAFQGKKSSAGKTLSAFRSSMRHLGFSNNYGDQVFCEATRKCNAYDVFHHSQNIYTIDYDKNEVVKASSSRSSVITTRIQAKIQILKWEEMNEIDTYFKWWELPYPISRYDINCWTKKQADERSLVHSSLIYFAHTKNMDKRTAAGEICSLKYKQKMIKEQNAALKKKSKIKPMQVSMKSKQHNRRKLIQKTIMDNEHKDGNHFLDGFTFGVASEDNTVCSIGDLSQMTPNDWYLDESIHDKSKPGSLVDTVIKTGIYKNKRKVKGKAVAERSGVTIVDISELAATVWRDQFGIDLDIKFDVIAIKGKQFHIAFCNGNVQSINDCVTSRWIFPCYEVDEKSSSICFPKRKIARHAFLWHVLVNVATVKWRQEWLKNMVHKDGIGGVTVLKEKQRRSNSLVKVVFKNHKYYFNEVGGNGEWECCIV